MRSFIASYEKHGNMPSMPALDAHRIFLSTVTAEFARYRTALATAFTAQSISANCCVSSKPSLR